MQKIGLMTSQGISPTKISSCFLGIPALSKLCACPHRPSVCFCTTSQFCRRKLSFEFQKMKHKC